MSDLCAYSERSVIIYCIPCFFAYHTMALTSESGLNSNESSKQ